MTSKCELFWELTDLHPPDLAALILVLARLLYPKLRKRSGRLGGKGAPGSARAAVLSFLAALDPAELGPVVELFLESLSGAFREEAAAADKQPAMDTFADARCVSCHQLSNSGSLGWRQSAPLQGTCLVLTRLLSMCNQHMSCMYARISRNRITGQRACISSSGCCSMFRRAPCPSIWRVASIRVLLPLQLGHHMLA